MSILFKDGCFKMDTANTTYSFKITEYDYVMHCHYGKKITDVDLEYVYPKNNGSYITASYEDKKMFYRPNDMPQEYSGYGVSDFRITALRVKHGNGSRAADLRYFSHQIIEGAESPPNMPHAFASSGEEVKTLKLILKDKAAELYVNIYYTVYEKTDVITRFSEIVNRTGEKIAVEKAASLQLDLLDSDYDFIMLDGAWARERHISRNPLHSGMQGYASRRGTSSHQKSPFFCLCRKNADENIGEAYGVHLVYSGNHQTQIEVDQYGRTRVLSGINDEGFAWVLAEGESFVTPESFFTYSDKGLNGMSQNLHEFIINNIINPKWLGVRRPLLINNWEATYFDFDEEKLVGIAKTAATLGIEMFVMDDGWFGYRNDDKTSLGDWYPNGNKLPKGLKHLAERINAAGMKFGIWMEPEMISEDSELYRKHPDWVLSIPARPRSIGRNQFVLDLINPEVKRYVTDIICSVLGSANIAYLKWDMNRYLTEVYSATLQKESQGEAYHRYVSALYEILDIVTKRFPELLIEHCSGGGGRFDTGMLYYSPQIWTSDDTDAGERVAIQLGTSLGFPVTSMGSHVSAVPNHQTNRVTSMETRANVAFSGTFGYELNVNGLTDGEREAIRKQCAFYKENYELINFGKFSRLAFVDEKFGAWCFTSHDKKEILMFAVQLDGKVNAGNRFVKIPSAEPTFCYTEKTTNLSVFGDTLNNLGVHISHVDGERVSFVKHFIAE